MKNFGTGIEEAMKSKTGYRVNYYQISNRTLKVSQKKYKNISRYYSTYFQYNPVNFYPQAKILEV